jgi:hypothetical protein
LNFSKTAAVPRNSSELFTILQYSAPAGEISLETNLFHL